MTRWTPSGWVVCLGANWPFCNWEGRNGIDFKLETDARRACSSPVRYRQLVQRLSWVARKNGERGQSVRGSNDPSMGEPWSALALFQRKILAAHGGKSVALGDATNKINKQEIGDKVISKIQRMRNQNEPVNGTPSWNQAKTTLTVPADCLSKPKKSNNKVQFHPCFAGGRQIFLKEDGELEYTLEPMLLAPDNSIKAKQWNISFCVCTVHRDETNLVVAVSTEGTDGSKATYNVPLPYTKGEWHTTEPVTIALEEGGPKKISLTRAYKKFGISLKQITLSPLPP